MAYMFDDFYYFGKYRCGCLSICACKLTSTELPTGNGTCAGIGCCQANIPTDLTYYPYKNSKFL
uniref:Uncharacterized protein n=1 Tax=Leersia perrieri TaxID=77586 RepID=A0A0D9W3X2_9ORYZ